jgi:hypothetical protein
MRPALPVMPEPSAHGIHRIVIDGYFFEQGFYWAWAKSKASCSIVAALPHARASLIASSSLKYFPAGNVAEEIITRFYVIRTALLRTRQNYFTDSFRRIVWSSSGLLHSMMRSIPIFQPGWERISAVSQGTFLASKSTACNAGP